MICPKCNQNIENNDFCPFCGYTFSEKTTIIDNEEIEFDYLLIATGSSPKANMSATKQLFNFTLIIIINDNL